VLIKKKERRKKKKKKKGETSGNPPELPPVLKYPPKLKKLPIHTPELSIALNLDPSVQIMANFFFKKDQNTPYFHF
jgi:hypothetical protein